MKLFSLTVALLLFLGLQPGVLPAKNISAYYKTTASTKCWGADYDAKDSLGKIYLFCPYNTEKKTLNIFFNKKKFRSIRDGQRIVFVPSSGLLLKITILPMNDYTDPSTLAPNTRSIILKKGKDYYFLINGRGELNYIVNPEKGKEKFENKSDFAGEPVMVYDNPRDSLTAR